MKAVDRIIISCCIEIGKRPRHSQNPVIAPGRKAHALCRFFQECPTLVVRGSDVFQKLPVGIGIQANAGTGPIPLFLNIPSPGDTGGNIG